jgi:hypothetical protein
MGIVLRKGTGTLLRRGKTKAQVLRKVEIVLFGCVFKKIERE